MQHNLEYLKRQAKKLKKEQGITHAEALNKIAVSVGYSNWKNLINDNKIR
jgi:Glyoxalase superfamily protein